MSPERREALARKSAEMIEYSRSLVHEAVRLVGPACIQRIADKAGVSHPIASRRLSEMVADGTVRKGVVTDRGRLIKGYLLASVVRKRVEAAE